LIPDKAEFLVQIHQPRQLVEAITTFEAFQQLQKLGAAKEVLNSTQYRRFYQLVAYFEKELGAKWPELLDRLAGNGAALALQKVGQDRAPVMLVIQGKDEQLMQKFVKLAITILDQEIARQEVKAKVEKEKYGEFEFYHVGPEFCGAQVGASVILSNNQTALKAALDLHSGKERKSLADFAALADAQKLLPKDPLASFWLNMDPVRDTPQGKEFYKRPRDLNLTILFGSIVDLLSRTPFVSGGFYKEKDGFLATVRMPKGREGMGPELGLHLPPAGQPGSRPLLEPRNVLYSNSFYLNLPPLWDERVEFLGDKAAKDFEAFDKRSGQFLSGIQVSKLLKEAGPYQRFVAVNQPKVGYKITPKTSIPAFAVVSEMRDPEAFTRSVSTVLRGAGLLYSTTQTKFNLVEEKHGDITLVGYRFPENVAYKPDVNDIRFNFSPCFARVGNQFMVCSTLELGHEMIDLLQKEATGAKKGENLTANHRFYGTGVAEILQIFEDQLVTQLILDQSLTPDDAKTQIRDFIGIVRRAGNASIQVEYQPNEFHYDIRIKSAKP